MDNSLDLLHSVLDTKLVAICILKAVLDSNNQIIDFRIQIANKEAERHTGRSDLEGKLYAQLWPGIKECGIFDKIVRVFRSGHPRQIEYHYQSEGVDNWCHCMFVSTHDGIVATHLDITGRKKAELKFKELDLKKKSEIYQATISAQEKERKRIADTLHNGLGQLLYAAKLGVESIGKEAKAANDEMGKSKDLALKMLSEAIKETRRISHILSPTILDEFGLKEAIEDTCDQFRSVAEISLTYKSVRKLNNPIELIVYRSLQELLHNMAKHSKATKCSVLVNVKFDEVLLSIRDNGVGFDDRIHKGLGLQSIKSQIALLQGSLVIQSTAGEGTAILIHIPICPNTEQTYNPPLLGS